MAYFYYTIQTPTDVDAYVPKKHTIDELDSLLIPPDKRDSCGDNYAEFKKCIAVQH